MSRSPSIVLDHLSIQYTDQPVIDHLSHTFLGGKWHIILGRSGVGKTSLLRAIANLLPAQYVDGQITDADAQPLHSHIAWMSQRDELLPWLNIDDNIYLGYRLRGEKPPISLGETLLERAGLNNYRQQHPAELSGGQKQRVALVRTLLEQRPIVLMDEPFSALDAVTRYQLQELAAGLLAEKTVIMITHDPTEALRLADYLYIMEGQPVALNAQTLPEGEPPRRTDSPGFAAAQQQLLLTLQDEPL